MQVLATGKTEEGLPWVDVMLNGCETSARKTSEGYWLMSSPETGNRWIACDPKMGRQFEKAHRSVGAQIMPAKVAGDDETTVSRTSKKESIMTGNVLNKLKGHIMPSPVDGIVWDLLTGKVGVQLAEGIVTFEETEDGVQLNNNLFDTGAVTLPAFAMPTDPSDIRKGDLIRKDGRIQGWVTKTPTASRRTFELLKPNGMVGTMSVPKSSFMGMNLAGLEVIKDLMNLGGEGGIDDLHKSLLPLVLLGEDGGRDMDDILPLVIMSQGGLGGGEGAGNLNNMLPLLLLSKGGGSSDSMLPLLLMGGGLGGGDNNNPMQALLMMKLLGKDI